MPLISVTGVLLFRSESTESRPVDWRLLGGGLAFGAAVLGIGLGNVPYSQELVFLLSMAVICTMLVIVTRELDAASRRAILYTALIIFAFRATPGVGDGYFWWTLDILKFDAEFYGVLRQTSAMIGIVAMWLFARQLTAILDGQDAAVAHLDRALCSRRRPSRSITACKNGRRRISASARAGSR